MINYRVHNSPQHIYILSRIDPTHILMSYSIKILFNIIAVNLLLIIGSLKVCVYIVIVFISQAVKPLLVGCPSLLTQSIGSYPSCGLQVFRPS
jgi:hypothetical protein